MTDQDVRNLLERMAAEEPVPFLDAEPLTRQARRRAARTVVVGALGVAAAIAVLFAGASQLREASPRVPANPPEDPPVDLGIFEPVAGRMVYSSNSGDSGLWSVDLNAPSPVSTLVPLEVEGTPLGWSSDGTELLLMREDPTDQTFPFDSYLYILHADGTETRVTTPPIYGSSSAAISPDGKRVAYVAGTGFEDETGTLFIVDAGGGQPVRIAEIVEEGGSPTFSPNGTQIAYLSGPGEHVWVANSDGTNAHEILAVPVSVSNLTWSPAGDRIATDSTHPAIYTFAPDGSDFTQVITRGFRPHWSPDGSQIAYMRPYGEPLVGSPGLAIADADGSNVRTFGFGSSGPWHPGTGEAP